DLSTSPNVDLAGAHMLAELHERLADSGVTLSLAEMHSTVRDLLEADGLLQNLSSSGRRVGMAEIIDG
ncbi:MAG: STAS domain-containing protein, partial [Deltaproteobacteria bacterium]|nr:STAS domain-containing protein [Deltaproteobacteria bacterium]